MRRLRESGDPTTSSYSSARRSDRLVSSIDDTAYGSPLSRRFRGDDAESLFLHKLIPPVPLRVQQRGEIAVIDPRRRRGGDGRFGVAGDAKAGGLDHVEVVGAVANR